MLESGCAPDGRRIAASRNADMARVRSRGGLAEMALNSWQQPVAFFILHLHEAAVTLRQQRVFLYSDLKHAPSGQLKQPWGSLWAGQTMVSLIGRRTGYKRHLPPRASARERTWSAIYRLSRRSFRLSPLAASFRTMSP